MNKQFWNRRDVFKLGAAFGFAPAFVSSEENHFSSEENEMWTRAIPASGEPLGVIGLGTYRVFDVASTAENVIDRAAIVELLTSKGGSLIDSSPMYGQAERMVGDVTEELNDRDSLFLATKVWTDGKAAGVRQMTESAELMNTSVIDLMQVHNLRDTAVHMSSIREWQEQGRVRYSGLTHYTSRSLSALQSAMRQYKPEFIQINYSLLEPEAGAEILPMAMDLGVAVLINRPFVTGQLFRAVGNRPVPEWAAEFAPTWGQFFLKWIISNPAVTCVIPATSKPHHMADNLSAGFGPLPDAATRKRMIDYIAAL